MKTGPLKLARKTGCPLVPVGLDARWKLPVRSHWDELILPLPFSRVVAVAGEAVRVPPDATAEDISAIASSLEERMNLLDARAAAELCRRGDPL